jgi:hypothetical protein
VAKQSRGELVVVGFNYDLVEAKTADKVRSAAGRICDKVKRTIEVCNDLQAGKESVTQRACPNAVCMKASRRIGQHLRFRSRWLGDSGRWQEPIMPGRRCGPQQGADEVSFLKEPALEESVEPVELRMHCLAG